MSTPGDEFGGIELAPTLEHIGELMVRESAILVLIDGLIDVE